MEIRKLIGPGLFAILLVGVGGGIIYSYFDKRSTDKLIAEEAQTETVKGLIASEREPFFTDAKVLAVLKRNGIVLTLQKAGSREIALRRDAKTFDFAFPSGITAAEKLKRDTGAKQIYPVSYSPMAIASWRPLVPMLTAAGLVEERQGNFYLTDVKKLLAMMEAKQRWKDLPENKAFPVNKPVFISTTDVRKSNSAAMYLALMSYIANGAEVVQSEEQANTVSGRMTALFLRQGYQESTSAGPFEDYVAMGMGKAPLVMIYESQFVQMQTSRDKPNNDMILIYPEPTVFSKNAVVPFSPKGDKLAQLLTTNPELQQLAAEYGMRTQQPEHFQSYVKKRGVSVPQTLINVIDPPSYEVMEKLISQIEKQMQ